ncbi:unnamed protein product [Sphagnum jensenii]|uniref:histidine kinase n=1 Tax=Sphagnum jensenii TaxID=128206 RepID=A0ABP0VHJ5_9BRYO
MSHKLRTPLNIINLGLELSVNKIPPHSPNKREQELSEILVETNHACQVTLDTLNELLCFNEVGHDDLSLDKERVNVLELITNNVKVFATQIRTKNIDLIISEDMAQAEKCIRASDSLFVDKLKMNQVLSNLISNAVQFTQDGGKIVLSMQFIPNSTSTSFKSRVNNLNRSSKSLKRSMMKFSNGMVKNMYQSLLQFFADQQQKLLGVKPFSSPLKVQDRSCLSLKNVALLNQQHLARSSQQSASVSLQSPDTTPFTSPRQESGHFIFEITDSGVGEIKAYSDGPGKGSTFTLILPMKRVCNPESERMALSAYEKHNLNYNAKYNTIIHVPVARGAVLSGDSDSLSASPSMSPMKRLVKEIVVIRKESPTRMPVHLNSSYSHSPSSKSLNSRCGHSSSTYGHSPSTKSLAFTRNQSLSIDTSDGVESDEFQCFEGSSVALKRGSAIGTGGASSIPGTPASRSSDSYSSSEFPSLPSHLSASDLLAMNLSPKRVRWSRGNSSHSSSAVTETLSVVACSEVNWRGGSCSSLDSTTAATTLSSLSPANTLDGNKISHRQGSSASDQSQSATPSSESEERCDTPRNALKLLVVDDSRMNRRMLVRILQADGHFCEEAEDGRDAYFRILNLFKKLNGDGTTSARNSARGLGHVYDNSNRSNDKQGDSPAVVYDAIIMDNNMPNMNGASCEIIK